MNIFSSTDVARKGSAQQVIKLGPAQSEVVFFNKSIFKRLSGGSTAAAAAPGGAGETRL